MGDVVRNGAHAEPDFKALFEGVPGLYMVLDPDLRVVAASDAYIQATLTRRENIIGRYVFDVFPDNPDDPSADATSKSFASFKRVLRTGETDVMMVQRHDVRRPEAEGGEFETRYWSPINSPIFNKDGSVAYILHRVENVTEFVELQRQGVELSKLTDELRERTVQMEADLYARSREVAETNLKLKQANEGQAKLLDLAHVLIRDHNDCIVSWNSGAQWLYGYSKEEAIGKVSHDLLQTVFPVSLEAMNESLAGTGHWQGDLVHTAKDGHRVVVASHQILHRDENGNTIAVIEVNNDITEQKRAEEALKKNERRLGLALDAARAASWEVNLETGQHFWDERFMGLLLVPPEKFAEAEQRWAEFVLPEDRARAAAEFAAACEEGGPPYDSLFRARRMDGVVCWYHSRGTIINEPGSVRRMVGVVQDITERKEAEEALRKAFKELDASAEELAQINEELASSNEEIAASNEELRLANDDLHREMKQREQAEAALRESEERLRAVVANSQDAIIVAEPAGEGRIVSVNPAAARVFGWSEDEMVGLTRKDLLDTSAPALRLAMEAREQTGQMRAELVYKRKDGTEFIGELTSGTFTQADGRVYSVAIVRDITRRKQAEERVLHQNAVQNAINRILQEAIVSESEEDLGRFCLAVAEELTGSKFGFIGEITVRRLLDDIAISDPGWEVCRMAAPNGHGKVPLGFKVHGIYGRVLLDGKGFFTNEPDSHPDRIGIPEGHPPLEAFLGVPLIHEGKTIGMIGLGNREGGYRKEDLKALEALAGAVVQVFMRRRVEESLRRSEEQYRELVQNANSAIIRWRRDGNITFFNEYAQRFFGYRDDEIIGKQASILVPEVDSTGGDLKALVEDIVNKPESYANNTNENIRRDGSRVWMTWTNKPIFDENGQVTEIFAVGSDVTDRVEAEQRERELETQQRDFYRKTILAATGGRLVMSDRDEIEKMLGKPLAAWKFGNMSEYTKVRHSAFELAERECRSRQCFHAFISCVGEMLSNALKHASGGTASVHRTDDGIIFCVNDRGQGIEAINLPDVAFTRGYSTAGTGGMGYKLILGSSDKVYLSTGPDGTVVAALVKWSKE